MIKRGVYNFLLLLKYSKKTSVPYLYFGYLRSPSSTSSIPSKLSSESETSFSTRMKSLPTSLSTAKSSNLLSSAYNSAIYPSERGFRCFFELIMENISYLNKNYSSVAKYHAGPL